MGASAPSMAVSAEKAGKDPMVVSPTSTTFCLPCWQCFSASPWRVGLTCYIGWATSPSLSFLAQRLWLKIKWVLVSNTPEWWDWRYDEAADGFLGHLLSLWYEWVIDWLVDWVKNNMMLARHLQFLCNCSSIKYKPDFVCLFFFSDLSIF